MADEPVGSTRLDGERKAGEPSERSRAAGAGFYSDLFTATEVEDLGRAGVEPSLDDEIGLLRVAIRRGVESDESLETIGRSVQRLAQALRVRRELRGEGLRELEDALARVLEEIGRELG